MTKPSWRPLFFDRAAVAACVALSESTVEKLVRENKFPKPRILSGRRVAWLVREVEEWAESRPVSDLLPPENTTRHAPRNHTLAERIARIDVHRIRETQGQP